MARSRERVGKDMVVDLVARESGDSMLRTRDVCPVTLWSYHALETASIEVPRCRAFRGHTHSHHLVSQKSARVPRRDSSAPWRARGGGTHPRGAARASARCQPTPIREGWSRSAAEGRAHQQSELRLRRQVTDARRVRTLVLCAEERTSPVILRCPCVPWSMRRRGDPPASAHHHSAPHSRPTTCRETRRRRRSRSPTGGDGRRHAA